MRRQRSPSRGALFLAIALLFYIQVEEIFANSGASSSELVESLRRELMADNYDYLSSAGADEEDPRRPRPPTEAPSSPAATLPPLLPFVNDIYFTQPPGEEAAAGRGAPRAAGDGSLYDDLDDERPTRARLGGPRGLADYTVTVVNNDLTGQEKVDPRAPHKNDLLYYLDDAHLTRRPGDLNLDDDRLSRRTGDLNLDDDRLSRRAGDLNLADMDDGPLSRRAGDLNLADVVDTTPEIKYKLLKVKAAGGGRRAGAGGYRRFVQEERADGVAVLSLDGAPFPPVRLARDRDSLEIAPPSADDDVSPH